MKEGKSLPAGEHYLLTRGCELVNAGKNQMNCHSNGFSRSQLVFFLIGIAYFFFSC